MTKPISWFEIPATDLDRARTFYQTIFDVTLTPHDMGPNRLAAFPYDRERHTGGCVMSGPGMEPSGLGTIIYLNASPSLDAVLDRVVPAGGGIALPRTALPPGMGFFAQIVDTEGNRVGVHALQ